ncbi:MAG TPA: flagellar type III secretion system protein FliR [Firmicutes bacterium]|nr:flagellar type III secretion system protein FliR [Bacillota bacterium]
MQIDDMLTRQLIIFILLLARIGGMFIYAPIFGSFSIPVRIRVIIALALAGIMTPLLHMKSVGWDGQPLSLALMVLDEIGVGLVIGFASALFILATQLAGQFIDLQIGFGFVNVVDPVSMRQVTIMGQVAYLLGTLIFLAIDGHHLLISAIAKSYEIVPPGTGVIFPAIKAGLLELFSGAFAIGFKIASPVIVALLLVDAAMGILARTVPQMNVFIVGFPLKIVGGLFLFALSLPLALVMLRGLFGHIETDILLILKRLSGR